MPLLRSYSLQNFIIDKLEIWFFKLGIIIAQKAYITIIITILITCICSMGFLNFYQEKNPLKLWVPDTSSFVQDAIWIMRNFHDNYRFEKIIFKADNILLPENLLKIMELHNLINNITTRRNLTINDFCIKIPFVKNLPNVNRFHKYSNIKNIFPARFYCDSINNLKKVCYENNILEIWNYDNNEFLNKNYETIINELNSYQINSRNTHYQNYKVSLGGIKYDDKKQIIKAQTILISWYLYVNYSEIDMNKVGNQAGTADWATEDILEWEEEFQRTIEDFIINNKNIEIFYESAKNFGNATNDALNQDIDLIVMGNFLMVIYVVITISKFDFLQFRLILGLIGIFLIALSFIASCGFCLALGIPYGPIHTSLPFLLMGLGVDDIFIILSNWYKIKDTIEINISFEEQIGHMLSHSGVSITVTTLTDILAFIIGCSTILPSLSSFCIYAAIGVFFTFCFIITCFVAVLVLDEKRIQTNRHSIIPCKTIKNFNNKSFCFLKATKLLNCIYSEFLLTKFGVTFIIIFTTIFTLYNGYHIQFLETKFDKNDMVPVDSKLYKYYKIEKEFYPLFGYDAAVFIGYINYTQEIDRIYDMYQILKSRTDLIINLSEWPDDFYSFVDKNYDKNLSLIKNDEEWRIYFSDFLYSPSGLKYRNFFKFEQSLICDKPASNIKIAMINFQFLNFNHSKQWLNAMHVVNDIVKNTNLTTGTKYITVWAKIFGTWTTEEIIEIEIRRNLIYTLICVLLCTFIIINNYLMCFLIFSCVFFTMINVCGTMYQMNVSIDIITCITLELAIGLCIDYASHVSHVFLITNDINTRQRILKTINSIGLAVVFGGCSTILSLSMLIRSKVFVFNTLFKVFILVVTFGLYFGMIFLPVTLYFIGSKIKVKLNNF